MLENPAIAEHDRELARAERIAERCDRAHGMLVHEFFDALRAGGPDALLSVHRDCLGLPYSDQRSVRAVVAELLANDDDAQLVAHLLVIAWHASEGRPCHVTATAALSELADRYALREVDNLNDDGAFDDGAY